jgi:hypothetical protein
MPDMTISGEIVLNTASGKTVRAEIETLKPDFIAYTLSSVPAGSDVTLQVNNLDLVVSVTFANNLVVPVTPGAANELTVTVPPHAVSGVVALTMANGETVECDELEIIEPEYAYLSNPPAEPAEIKASGVLVFDIANDDKLTDLQIKDVSVTYVIFDKKLYINVPDYGSGFYEMKLVSSDGTNTIYTIRIKSTDPVWDTSYVFFDFDGKDSWWGDYGAVENNPALSLNGNYFRINGDLTGGWIGFFWRNGANDLKTDGVTVANWVIKMDVNVLGPTTPRFKFRLTGSDGDFWAIFGGLQNTGGWYTVTIPLTDFFDGDGLGSNRLPNVQNIDGDFGLALAGEGTTNICIDNIRFEPK